MKKFIPNLAKVKSKNKESISATATQQETSSLSVHSSSIIASSDNSSIDYPLINNVTTSASTSAHEILSCSSSIPVPEIPHKNTTNTSAISMTTGENNRVNTSSTLSISVNEQVITVGGGAALRPQPPLQAQAPAPPSVPINTTIPTTTSSAIAAPIRFKPNLSASKASKASNSNNIIAPHVSVTIEEGNRSILPGNNKGHRETELGAVTNLSVASTAVLESPVLATSTRVLRTRKRPIGYTSTDLIPAVNTSSTHMIVSENSTGTKQQGEEKMLHITEDTEEEEENEADASDAEKGPKLERTVGKRGKSKTKEPTSSKKAKKKSSQQQAAITEVTAKNVFHLPDIFGIPDYSVHTVYVPRNDDGLGIRLKIIESCLVIYEFPDLIKLETTPLSGLQVGDVIIAVNHLDAYESTTTSMIQELQRKGTGIGRKEEQAALQGGSTKVTKEHVEDNFVRITVARPKLMFNRSFDE